MTRSLRAIWTAIAAALLVAACGGPQTRKQRIAEAERKSIKAEKLLDEVEAAIAKLEVDDADEPLEDAKELLADPNLAAYPEHKMLKDRAEAMDEKLVTAKWEVARRKLEAAVAERKGKIDAALAALDKALEAAKKPDATDKDVEEAADAEEDAAESIDDGKELEGRDSKYADHADAMRKKLDARRAELRLHEQSVTFRTKVIEAHKAATDLLQKAKADKDLAKQVEMYGAAMEKLLACSETATTLLAKSPELARSKVSFLGKNAAPEAVKTACATGARSAGDALAKKKKALADKKAAEEKAAEKAARAAEAKAKAEKAKADRAAKAKAPAKKK